MASGMHDKVITCLNFMTNEVLMVIMYTHTHLYLQCVIAQLYVLLLLHLWVHIIPGAVILGPPVKLNCLLIIWIKLLK